MGIKMHQNIFFVHHIFEQAPWQVLADLLVINVRMQNELFYVKVGGSPPLYKSWGGISSLHPHPQPPIICNVVHSTTATDNI